MWRMARILRIAAIAYGLAFPALAAIPTPVDGQITDAVVAADADHSGTTSKAEWTVQYRSQFDALDRDRDGVISRSEFEAAHDGMFDAIDSNHDGKVSHGEADAYHASHR